MHMTTKVRRSMRRVLGLRRAGAVAVTVALLLAAVATSATAAAVQ